MDILKNRCVQIVDNRLKWNGESNNYLQNLKPLYKEILEILSFDFVIQREIKDYILKTIESTWIYERNTAWDKKNYIEQLILHENGGHGNSLGDIGLNDVNDKKLSCIEQEILAEFVCKDIKRELLRLRYPENEKYNEESIVYQVGDTILQDHLLEHYSQTLLSLYSETYADLQMILVLNISYEEYLKGFVCDEDVKINDITRCNEHINRISTIADLMMQKGIWQETVFENPKVNTFAHIIKANIDKTHQEGSLLSVQNQSLYEYLETCLEVGKEHYALSSQEPEIEEVRKIVGIMKKYDDAQQVYTKVCELLSEYREELAKLSM